MRFEVKNTGYTLLVKIEKEEIESLEFARSSSLIVNFTSLLS